MLSTLIQQQKLITSSIFQSISKYVFYHLLLSLENKQYKFYFLSFKQSNYFCVCFCFYLYFFHIFMHLMFFTLTKRWFIFYFLLSNHYQFIIVVIIFVAPFMSQIKTINNSNIFLFQFVTI